MENCPKLFCKGRARGCRTSRAAGDTVRIPRKRGCRQVTKHLCVCVDLDTESAVKMTHSVMHLQRKNRIPIPWLLGVCCVVLKNIQEQVQGSAGNCLEGMSDGRSLLQYLLRSV